MNIMLYTLPSFMCTVVKINALKIKHMVIYRVLSMPPHFLLPMKCKHCWSEINAITEWVFPMKGKSETHRGQKRENLGLGALDRW